MSRFSVVSIVLDYDDNPHLVFESLNAKGLKLEQSDLIRNYFFMKIHVDEQSEIYANYWEPMQNRLQSNLTEFIRHYLMKDGKIVKQTEVYFALKDKVKNNASVLEDLSDILIFSNYYLMLLEPDNSDDLHIKVALNRLKRLEVTTAYPFLLNCFNDYMMRHLSGDEFLEILHVIENYIIRRFVCNYTTNLYNKIFPYLYQWAKNAQKNNGIDFVTGVKSELQKRDYPRDNLFRSRLIEAKLYGKGERAIKTKLILETIELYYNHKEKIIFDNLTIEHILPQTIENSEWWKAQLGEDWQAEHEINVHTLGNLTLTAYNSELSNSPYPSKKKILLDSHVSLNSYFADVAKWDIQEISRRSDILADVAMKCWAYFGDEKPILMPTSAEEATGKVPQSLIIFEQRFLVKSWVDVLTKTLSTIADLEPERFDLLVSLYPKYISNDPTRFRRKITLSNGYYVEANLSAKDIYRFCEQAAETIGLALPEDWKVETV